MITLIAHVDVKAGMMEKAQEFIKEMIPEMLNNEPGTLEYKAYTVGGDGNESKIVFYEKYEDEEAYKTNHENMSKRMSDMSSVLDFSTMRVQQCNLII
ncbi:MAG: putative quinol monooxygenase [Candidatus Kariarchaeaceae archaeon]|jgi:quinol monooxygenase YgiN